MIVRHPTQDSESLPERAARQPLGADVEPKAEAGSAWLERMEDRADELLHRDPEAAPDFDIAAWFALEAAEAHERCITECWYG